MKRIPLDKVKPLTWVLMGLFVAGMLGLEIYLNAAAVFGGPAYIKRPFATELQYYFLGGKYRSQLRCRAEPFERVHRLRADDYIEATAFLAKALPDCEIEEIRRVRERMALLRSGRRQGRGLTLF